MAVSVLWFLLTWALVGLQFVIMVFSGHTHLLFCFILQVLVDYIESKSSIEPNGSRISLIEFSTIAQTKVVFGLLSSKAYALEVKNAIDSLGYDAGL